MSRPRVITGELERTRRKGTRRPRPAGRYNGGPVQESVQVFTRGAYFCPPPAFGPEMDAKEWLKKLEDFFRASGVPTMDYGAVERYLLTDPVRRELYPPGQATDDSFEELKKRLLNAYGLKRSPAMLTDRFHTLQQREGQSIQQFAQEVAELGRRAGVSERDIVTRFSGGVTSREVYRAIRLQELPTLTEARKLATRIIQVKDDYQEKQQPQAGVARTEKTEMAQKIDAMIREMGNLAKKVEQLERAAPRPPGLHPDASVVAAWTTSGETAPSFGPEPGQRLNGLEISLLLDSGAVVSVVPLSTWHKSTGGEPLEAAGGSILLGDGRRVRLCGQGTLPLQVGSCRGRIHVAIVESLVEPGILGMNFLDQYVKLIDWQAGEMTMTDGSRVQITHEPAPATRPGIGCAWITASPQEVPREETVEEVPENDSGELGACERVLVDRAECSAQNRQTLRRLHRKYGKVIHRSEQKQQNADALSRRGCKQGGLECNPAEWQESDKELQQIRKWSTQRTWPQVAPEGSRLLRSLWSQRDRIVVHEGTICRKWETPDTGETRLLQVIPRQRIPEILAAIHNQQSGDHLGVAKTLAKLHEAVRERAGREQRRQKFWKDRKAHGPVYEAGDQVWMQVPDKTKLGAYWDGPYEVQKKLDWNTYRVKEMKGRRQRLVVHFDRLKPHHGSRQPREEQQKPREKRKTRRPPWLRDFIHDPWDEHGTCS
ncbi:hypothetical protein T01_14385 [Trichinella spiralis]|uniref:Uncharacterized protein n=1 Tax=Trichinella spiralis TaxID=6334 RepID=A0A0V1B2G2_TRISP|nr:hypothetical protein T01_14385 [Trichinella spiralis]